MRKEISTGAVALLGGAAAGAIAMYLLDPERGDARRGQIAGTASQAAETTRGSAHKLISKLSDYAQDLANQVSRQASTVSGHVSDSASSAADKAQAAVDRAKSQLADSAQALADRARSYADNARDQANDQANSVYNRAKTSVYRRAGVQESHPYRVAGEVTAGTVGALALGAGLMYFFDPAKGRARRAWAQQKAESVFTRANKSAKGYSKHVGNKIKGMAANASSAVPEEWSDAVHRATQAAVSTVTHTGADAAPNPM